MNTYTIPTPGEPRSALPPDWFRRAVADGSITATPDGLGFEFDVIGVGLVGPGDTVSFDGTSFAVTMG